MRYVLPITVILLGTLTCGPDAEPAQADRRHDAGKADDAATVSPSAQVWKASYTAEAAGQFQAALSALTELPAPQRESYLASFRRGWLLYRLNQHAESVAAYKLAAMAEPASIEARVGLLMPLMALTRLNDVAVLAEDVLKRDPEIPGAATPGIRQVQLGALSGSRSAVPLPDGAPERHEMRAASAGDLCMEQKRPSACSSRCSRSRAARQRGGRSARRQHPAESEVLDIATATRHSLPALLTFLGAPRASGGVASTLAKQRQLLMRDLARGTCQALASCGELFLSPMDRTQPAKITSRCTYSLAARRGGRAVR
jgi:hypothetical protein